MVWVIVVVLDFFGVGVSFDVGVYGDEGVNIFGYIL